MHFKVTKVCLIFFMLQCAVADTVQSTSKTPTTTQQLSARNEAITKPEEEKEEPEAYTTTETEKTGEEKKPKNTKKNHVRVTAAFPVYRSFGVEFHPEPDFRPFGSIAYARHFDRLFIEFEGLYFSLPSTDPNTDDPDASTTTKFTTIGGILNAGLRLIDTAKVALHLGIGGGIGINKTDSFLNSDQEVIFIGKTICAPVAQIFLGFSYKIINNVHFDTRLRYLYVNKYGMKKSVGNSVIEHKSEIEDSQILDLSVGITWNF